MTISLYDLSVGTFQQTVSGMLTVLEKGADYANANGLDVNEYVGMSVHDDMLPFLFQVNCVELHSVDCLKALRDGEITPPKSTAQRNYQELQQMLLDVQTQLEAVDKDDINSLAGGVVIFKFGGNDIPFTTENYVQSFALPNLQFHAATAYDILRAQGEPLGKADFLGKMRIGV